MRKLFYKFRIIRNILDFKTLIVVYLASVQFIFLYDVIVWDCTHSSHINVLPITVISLIKIIVNKPRLCSKN